MIVKPLEVTLMDNVTVCALVSLTVATHVPAESPVTTRFHVGPEALAAEKLAMGVVPPQLLV